MKLLQVGGVATDEVWGVAFSPDGRLLATGSADGTARLWDTTGRGTVEPLATLTGAFKEIVFSPDGTVVATGGGDHIARLWEATGRGTVEPLATLPNSEPVLDVAFSPDGGLLATGSGAGTARLWDTAGRGTVEPRAILAGHTEGGLGGRIQPRRQPACHR